MYILKFIEYRQIKLCITVYKKKFLNIILLFLNTKMNFKLKCLTKQIFSTILY